MKAALFLVGGFLCVGLLLGACHQRRTYYQGPSIEGFRFGAHAVIAGPSADTLRVSATAENVSDHPAQDEWGTCYRLNRLAVVAQIGARTWNSKTWEIGQIPDTGLLRPLCGDAILTHIEVRRDGRAQSAQEECPHRTPASESYWQRVDSLFRLLASGAR